jgi:hypothetical protein
VLQGVGVAQPDDEHMLDHVGTFERISHHLLHHLQKGIGYSAGSLINVA